MNPEQHRLEEDREGKADWKRWGPYLAERAWGTVREDYSPDGDAWRYFPHDHARSRAYRWGEDGLGGISDRHQHRCFALALWNGKDPFLKERLYGLSGKQGNHGEDVKEYYYYLDSTPTHSYMKFLYKYPQARFPYEPLEEENRRRGYQDPEYELLDTGVFDDDRYFDVVVEYAKASPEDILVLVSATNRGPEPAHLELLPTLWFRNSWSWVRDPRRPQIHALTHRKHSWQTLKATSGRQRLSPRWLYCEDAPELLFTEVETNRQRLYGVPNGAAHVKDGINDYVVHGATEAVNGSGVGTKAAARYQCTLGPGETASVRLRLADRSLRAPFQDFDEVLKRRREEADAFYAALQPAHLTEDQWSVQRQAFAGLLWTKQTYLYDVQQWLEGDPAYPPPPSSRWHGRNADWRHVSTGEVLSMPDKWEFPWFAAWDTAFHCIPLALVDPEFAKEQLVVLLREWYLHPNGQIPAYEWSFGDVNPPVHAWACWRVYQIERKYRGEGDTLFLERVFQKLLLNFTWWVNRKDLEGDNIFQGGFMGLDNIGVFDHSQPLPRGGHLEQSDSTAWMAMYCLNMLTIALELARANRAYEDMASKFFEHFLRIAYAMQHIGRADLSLWDEADGWFYSIVHFPDGAAFRLKVRSIVGLIALFAVETIEPETLEQLPGFRRRMEWFLRQRPDLCRNVAQMDVPGLGQRRLLSVLGPGQLQRVLARALDEQELLSLYGIRSLSAAHSHDAYVLSLDGQEFRVGYEPAESQSGVFGGNSNWRGPVWFPINYLAIESLQKFFHYCGPSVMVECPTGSGRTMNLWEVAAELSRRLIGIFARDDAGRRPVFGGYPRFPDDPHWRDHIPFHEYFHGDTGAGLGASHQTGWTGLVAKLIQQLGVEPTESLRRSSVSPGVGPLPED
jgi:hypothetical protein